MRKTNVYPNDEQAQRLARLAPQEGRSQAEILRAAIDAYQRAASHDSRFALTRTDSRVLTAICDRSRRSP